MFDILILILCIYCVWIFGVSFIQRFNIRGDEEVLIFPIGISILTIIVCLFYLFFGLAIFSIQLIIIVSSIILTCFLFMKNLYQKKYFLHFFLFCLFFIFLCLPAIIGGEQYYVMRGNIFDHFHYISAGMAAYSHTYTFYQNIDPVFILSNDVLMFGQGILASLRPAAVLLFSSTLSPEYGDIFARAFYFNTFFTALLLPSVYYAVLKCTKGTFLHKNSSYFYVLVALAYSIGFWGQISFDINAWSQIAAIPLLTTLTFYYVYLLNKIILKTLRFTEYLIEILLSIASFYIYPECAVIYFVLLFVYTLMALYSHKKLFNLRVILIVFSIPFCVIVSCFYQWAQTVNMFFAQLANGTNNAISWLWKFQAMYWFGNAFESDHISRVINILPSALGLSFFTGGSDLPIVIHLLITIFVIFLNLFLIITILNNLLIVTRNLSDNIKMLKVFIIAYMLFAVYLIFTGELFTLHKFGIYFSPLIFIFLLLGFFDEDIHINYLKGKQKIKLALTLFFPIIIIGGHLGFGLYRVFTSSDVEGTAYYNNYQTSRPYRFDVRFDFNSKNEFEGCNSFLIDADKPTYLHYMKLKLLYAGKKYYTVKPIQNYYSTTNTFMLEQKYDCSAILHPSSNIIIYNSSAKTTEELTSYPEYLPLPSEVKASDPKKFLKIGKKNFYGYEPTGIWSDEKAIITILTNPKEALTINIIGFPYIPQTNIERKASIFINDNKYAEHLFSLDNESHNITINVSKEQNVNGELNIKLDFEAMPSPLELGLSSDPRKLGFHYQSISINKAE